MLSGFLWILKFWNHEIFRYNINKVYSFDNQSSDIKAAVFKKERKKQNCQASKVRSEQKNVAESYVMSLYRIIFKKIMINLNL